MIYRETYMDFLEKWRDKRIIKVVTGIRRCGKSTLLKMHRDNLIKAGVEESQILFVNFEDLDNEPLHDYKVLYKHVKEHLQEGKMNYIFFDEIQTVEGFQKVVDSLFLLDNVDIYITGSNAYMLSGEIATLLTGRYVELRVYPFSFAEYRMSRPETEAKEESFRRYMQVGGFPYTLQLDDIEQTDEYLSGLYNTIVLKDVMAHKKLTDINVLSRLCKLMADNIGNISVIKRISDTLTSAGRKTSNHTIESYITALMDSYIFYPAYRIDVKGMDFLKTGAKYYLADIGLRNVMVGRKGGDVGHIVENMVYMELLRRGNEVYVGKNGNKEVDFVTIKGGKYAYYQVSLSIMDEATKARELAPLECIDDNFPKYLLTMDNFPPISHNGIEQMYLLDWLLERER